MAPPDAARSPRGMGSTVHSIRRRRRISRGRSGRRRSRSCRGPVSRRRRGSGPRETWRSTLKPDRDGNPRGFRSRKPVRFRRRGPHRGIPCRGCFRSLQCSPAWLTSRAGRRREAPPNPVGCSNRRGSCRSRIRKTLRRRPGGSATAWNAEGFGKNVWGPSRLLLWRQYREDHFVQEKCPSSKLE